VEQEHLALNADEWGWYSQPISGVELTVYGPAYTTALSVGDLSSSDIKQACCGQGTIKINGTIYKCDAPQDILDRYCGGEESINLLNYFKPASDLGCGQPEQSPVAVAETCANPYQTGAANNKQSPRGFLYNLVGAAFVYIIPSDGKNPIPLYINDTGGGLEQKHIDIYVGSLDSSNRLPASNGPYYSDQNATVCVLARQGEQGGLMQLEDNLKNQ
jgi:hypothetical protein